MLTKIFAGLFTTARPKLPVARDVVFPIDRETAPAFEPARTVTVGDIVIGREAIPIPLDAPVDEAEIAFALAHVGAVVSYQLGRAHGRRMASAYARVEAVKPHETEAEARERAARFTNGGVGRICADGSIEPLPRA